MQWCFGAFAGGVAGGVDGGVDTGFAGGVDGGENECRIYGSVFTGFTAVFASNGSDLGIFVTFSLDLIH